MGRLHRHYYEFPIKKANRALTSVSAATWERAGQKYALHVFQAAAKRVPAYSDWLKKNSVSASKITTFRALQSVPLTDKESYLNQYPLEQLCWDGRLERASIVSVSSGTTGRPHIWPRDSFLELETSFQLELLLATFFDIAKLKTLFIDCFSLGMYTGGIFVANAVHRIAQKGYPVTLVTPGIVLGDVLQVIERLQNEYEQIIISGYPPFLKDIVDAGQEAGIRWQDRIIRFMPSSESFSEEWRAALAEKVGQSDVARTTQSYYAAVDAAVLGVETPDTIALRQVIAEDLMRTQAVFGEPRLPSFMQYLPTLKYFELIDSELVFTSGRGCVPLVRYNIHDRGGLLSATDIEDRLGGKSKTQQGWQLPYLYLFGRSDHTVTLYGLNVYPEHIKQALEERMVSSLVSGKFQMATAYRPVNQNQYLKIDVELATHVKPKQEQEDLIRNCIVETLRRVNDEFRKLHDTLGSRAMPEVHLHPWGDEQYFALGTKQSWKKRTR